MPFPAGYSVEQRQQIRQRMLERLRARPGITHAAFSTGVPLVSAGGFSSFDFVIADRRCGDVKSRRSGAW